jgi:hypothetical protein
MSKASLRRRLANLEARANVPPRKPFFVIRRFVKPNGKFGGELCESDRAEANGEVWERELGESMQQFEERVLEDLSKRESSANGIGIRVIFFPREEP